MRPCVLLTLSLFSLCALAQSEPGIFVPSSKDGPDHPTYRESDIFAAFPELRGDKKLSECSNRIMSGATELVFISNVRQNEVTVNTVPCTPVAKGLRCGAVRRAKNYFLDSPEHFFSLENLTFARARPIAEAYNAGRVSGLPDWFGTSRPALVSIRALPDGHYRMRVGDVYCSGCTAVFNVELAMNGDESRLVYAGDPESVCF